MAEEIEAKVKVVDPAALRRRLAELGAAGGAPVLEVNRLFDDATGSLGRRGAALRVREVRRPDDRALLRTVLTWKGPRRAGGIKRRQEFETAVESLEALLAILAALDLAQTFLFEKRRTAWLWGGCEVVLDELPGLGWFAEVEGLTEGAVLAALADLGLDGEHIISQTYMQLLSEHLAAAGRDPTRAVF
jgi:adenylate cyclase class 2